MSRGRGWGQELEVQFWGGDGIMTGSYLLSLEYCDGPAWQPVCQMHRI